MEIRTFILILALFIPTIASSSIKEPLDIEANLPYELDGLQEQINIGYSRVLEDYTFGVKIKQYCDFKTMFGAAMYADKQTGTTLESTLTTLKNGYHNASPELKPPHHVYLEYERMAQTIYRHENKEFSDLYYRFYVSCLESGY